MGPQVLQPAQRGHVNNYNQSIIINNYNYRYHTWARRYSSLRSAYDMLLGVLQPAQRGHVNAITIIIY